MEHTETGGIKHRVDFEAHTARQSEGDSDIGRQSHLGGASESIDDATHEGHISESQETKEDPAISLVDTFAQSGLLLNHSIADYVIRTHNEESFIDGEKSPITAFSLMLAEIMNSYVSPTGIKMNDEEIERRKIDPEIYDIVSRVRSLFDLHFSNDSELKAVFDLFLPVNDSSVSVDERKLKIEVLKHTIEEKFREIKQGLIHPAQILLVNMMEDMIFGSKNKELLNIKPKETTDRLRDSCNITEPNFFTFSPAINPDGTVDTSAVAISNVGNGYLHTVVGDDNDPIMFIKINSGIKSALTVKPFILNGVEIPAGSLVSPHLDEPQRPEVLTHSVFSRMSNIHDLKGLEFLRLSMLSVSPEYRPDTFPKEVKKCNELSQLYVGMSAVSYAWIEPRHYVEMWEQR